MAVAITKPNGSRSDYDVTHKKYRERVLTFSGNYATGGESITAANVGLGVIEQVHFAGVAVAADFATANPVGFDFSGSKILFYESGASGAAAGEKTNAEAYPTGSFVRATFVGR